MQRTRSRISNRHTWGNINPSNMYTLPMFHRILRTSQAKDLGAGCRPYFVVGGKLLSLLMKVVHATYGFQLGLRDKPSASALEDDCREAVAGLNMCRLFRAESLRDGYDVSDILCYDIYWYYTHIANSASWRTPFCANLKGHSCQIYGRYDVSLIVDEQHRCMGWNSHGVSKVSVIDAAGVKQVEHKW